ncbi:hypothetical protein EHF33_14370 [Deinococcus psychrotolerans]|uniref:Spore coat protein U/FanG domain-containing protein n=1 Tax=Deinococcus psychrotolerans TaxID=2489213 RepID=A0A3G8YGN0_9DEIO|nr:spore coat protein U domain-containing protein [Deinococcus psychrotolerans]AZI44095.1 hypothetical protein EHF33_14370 [Deinococcus psychrotolerans]
MSALSRLISPGALRRCLLLSLLFGGAAQAQEAQSPPYTCTVVLPAGLDFGPYRFSQGVTLASGLVVTCSAAAVGAGPLHVSLSSNLYVGGQLPALTLGSERLSYMLAIGPGKLPFGPTGFPLTFDFSRSRSPAPLSVPLLGQIPAGQWKPAGTYQGNLEVTLNFLP